MPRTEISPGSRDLPPLVRRATADELIVGERHPDQSSEAAIVEHALWGTGRPTLRELVVDGDREVVVLRGRVRSYYEKQLAQATAQQVSANRQVINEIEVVGRH